MGSKNINHQEDAAMRTDFSASQTFGSFTVSAVTEAAKAFLAASLGAGAVSFTASGAGFAQFISKANAAGLVTRMPR
jgi:hypothetical protein